MTMMSLQILLPLNTFPGSNGETFLGNALSVAAFLEGELEALVLAADFRQVSNALGNLVLDVPSLVAGAREQCREKGAALVRSLKDQANVSGVRVRSSEIECHPAVFGDRATVASRYHDLVLMGLASSDDSLRSTAEAVIFGSGRPVMLLPEQHAIGRLDHVMVAWDGSRVAARAVNDARIVLERAEKVTITVVVDEKTLLNVEHSEIRGAGRPIAGVLQDEAARIGAGILVMGGFGHSRMRDFVLGGATRGILADLRMPVLLSH
jgi:nucleotide-binding universal stress UspA family protein